MRAREAEARADEADARARQAEADAEAAAKARDGLPALVRLGRGTPAWPTGPIVVLSDHARARPLG